MTRARNTCEQKTDKLRGEAQLYNTLTCQLRSRITKKRLKPWSETWLTLSKIQQQLSNTSRKQITEHKSHTRKVEMSITSFQAGPVRCPLDKNWIKIRTGHRGLVPALCKFFLMEHVGEIFFLEKNMSFFELRKIFGWVVKFAFHGSAGKLLGKLVRENFKNLLFSDVEQKIIGRVVKTEFYVSKGSLGKFFF